MSIDDGPFFKQKSSGIILCTGKMNLNSKIYYLNIKINNNTIQVQVQLHGVIILIK
jgi:hypothetical protein